MVRIDANGSVIKDDGTIAGGSGGAASNGSGNSSGGSGGGGRRLCRLPAYIDTFGFHLELKHFAVVLLFISMTMGGFGCESIRGYCSLFVFLEMNVVQ